MSDAAIKMRGTVLILAVVATALLSGCAAFQKRDSVTVGAIPDDYRTNHPIVIAEKEEALDLPVGASDRGATASQRASLEGFLANYDKAAAPVVTIASPSGSFNAAAAANVAQDFAHIARKNGVPGGRIMLASYQASPEEVNAPVRVSFSAMRAQTDKCGRWPEDVLNTSENKHYANFGCSYQNNVAAQIANPSDLLGPRKQSPIDAANRETVIGDYQARDSDFSESVDY
jgi:pilus assembly protein CpaD